MQLEQMLCPFKHWVIGGVMKSKQTGHSRRLTRLLLKSDVNFRRVEFRSFAAILYKVYNLLLYKIIIIKKERKGKLTSGTHRYSRKCRDHVQIFCMSGR